MRICSLILGVRGLKNRCLIQSTKNLVRFSPGERAETGTERKKQRKWGGERRESFLSPNPSPLFLLLSFQCPRGQKATEMLATQAR